MDEQWQPAVLNPNHLYCGQDWQNAQILKGKKVRVRPIDAVQVSEWMEIGCDANMFYEIHPEDVRDFAPWRPGRAAVCEHEILTD